MHVSLCSEHFRFIVEAFQIQQKKLSAETDGELNASRSFNPMAAPDMLQLQVGARHQCI